MDQGVERTYADLGEHIQRLADRGLLVTVGKPVNKDTEIHPLVRWQYRGGIAEFARKAFLFTNVTDSRGRKFPGASVAIGVLAGTPSIYAIGLNAKAGETGSAWLHAIGNPVPPRILGGSAPCQELIVTGDGLNGDGRGLDALPIPISTPGWDIAPYITSGLWVTRDPETACRTWASTEAI